MQLEYVTFVGPPIDDSELLSQLPENLAALLNQLNGFIQFHGGLHIRGACQQPGWHSLRDARVGENAFHHLYREVQPEDVPFGEDCVGDQFLLREGQVWRLAAETGELESLDVTFGEFMQQAQADPVEYLILQPLLQFQEEGGNLEPGQLLAAYPPFCTNQATDGVHLAAVSTAERRRFLAKFAARIRQIPEGGTFDINLVE